MSDTGPTDAGEFDMALSELVREAVLNQVEVKGGWDVNGDGAGTPAFTVEIYRPDG